LIKRKYIGPEKPGPWAIIFTKVNIDVFKLGALFISFGVAWLLFLIAFLTKQPWAHLLGWVVSILTLWYLPVGTIASLVIFMLLLVMAK